jgi:hypothetical protein
MPVHLGPKTDESDITVWSWKRVDDASDPMRTPVGQTF